MKSAMKSATKISYFYFLVTMALTAMWLSLAPAARADSGAIALDFSLSPSKTETAARSLQGSASPLALPTGAGDIPTSKSETRYAQLPPPPPMTAAETAKAPELPEPKESTESTESPEENPFGELTEAFQPSPVVRPQSTPTAPAPSLRSPSPDTLAFEQSRPDQVGAMVPDRNSDRNQAPSESASPLVQLAPDLDALFQGGSDSLVAIAIGNAEGTRTPEGGQTNAYKGHTDPGNGVWNLGTFSYQHGASSPQEADQRQIARLRDQAIALQQRADGYGLRLTLEEKLNGLDLANQSPRAALNRGGYIDRLKEAYDKGFRGQDAILWARTRSFLDPATNQWTAPGLGNTEKSITADQNRRLKAIARAVQTQGGVAAVPPSTYQPQSYVPPAASSSPPIPNHDALRNLEEQNANRIIYWEQSGEGGSV